MQTFADLPAAVPGERRSESASIGRPSGTTPAASSGPSPSTRSDRPSVGPSSVWRERLAGEPPWSWPDPAEGRAGSPSQEIHHVQRRP